MDLLPIIESLSLKRPLFHSEADFQSALAKEIQVTYPSAEVLLEYSPKHQSNIRIDILVRYNEYLYPIELKYPTKKLFAAIDEEIFSLKEQSAQDLGKYDFVKDLCRIESCANNLEDFRQGYVVWITNDHSYWNPPRNDSVGYAAFSVHHGAKKSGSMAWGPSSGIGTTIGRETELTLNSEYEIQWNQYSDLDMTAGLFKYALLKVASDGSIERPEDNSNWI